MFKNNINIFFHLFHGNDFLIILHHIITPPRSNCLVAVPEPLAAMRAVGYERMPSASSLIRAWHLQICDMPRQLGHAIKMRQVNAALRATEAMVKRRKAACSALCCRFVEKGFVLLQRTTPLPRHLQQKSESRYWRAWRVFRAWPACSVRSRKKRAATTNVRASSLSGDGRARDCDRCRRAGRTSEFGGANDTGLVASRGQGQAFERGTYAYTTS